MFKGAVEACEQGWLIVKNSHAVAGFDIDYSINDISQQTCV